jgi:hypothetical protein
VWRADPGQPRPTLFESERYPALASALRAEGFDVALVDYDDDSSTWFNVAASSDAVLVWVDPLSAGRTRDRLDEQLRELSTRGVLVSSHPDTIAKMGTKDVLYATRSLSWSLDVDRYDDIADVQSRLRDRLVAGQSRVLKPRRGNGGLGVLKVARASLANAPDEELWVRVQEAAPRDGSSEVVAWAALVDRLGDYLHRGVVIDQAFAPQVHEGMVRVYVVEREVVGFARQFAPAPEVVPPGQVFGIPGAKTMMAATSSEFADLRAAMESAWIPELQATLALRDDAMPLLWDADFLFRDRDASALPRFALAEINVSCVSPFPADAPTRLAERLRERLTST